MGNTTLRSAAHSQYADMFCWSTPRRCRLRPVRPGLRLGRSAGGGSIRTLLLLLLVSQGRRNVSNYGGASYKRTTFDWFFPFVSASAKFRRGYWPMGSDAPAVLQPHCPNRVNEETPNQFVFRSRISCETSFSCRDNFLHFLLRRPYQLTQ